MERTCRPSSARRYKYAGLQPMRTGYLRRRFPALCRFERCIATYTWSITLAPFGIVFLPTQVRGASIFPNSHAPSKNLWVRVRTMIIMDSWRRSTRLVRAGSLVSPVRALSVTGCHPRISRPQERELAADTRSRSFTKHVHSAKLRGIYLKLCCPGARPATITGGRQASGPTPQP
jgi:hypothetical protein